MSATTILSPVSSNAATDLLGSPELQAIARDLADRTAAKQGLPARIQDRAVLERVARLAGQENT